MLSETYGLYGFSRVCKVRLSHDPTLPAVIAVILICVFLSPFSSYAAESPYSIFIPCTVGNHAFIRYADGTKISVGEVKDIPKSTRWPSYTASKWGNTGTVCASAVNAVHILYALEGGRGRTFSIIPSETIAPAAGSGNAFVIDDPAGTAIFGAFAPAVGSKVSIMDQNGRVKPFDITSFANGNCYLVIHATPETSVFIMDIENRPGGRVIIWDSSGASIIARVVRPLGGVGRFAGTLFQEKGRIRANHTGVIDISTSPYGRIGGFQIIPLIHAFSPEMSNSWKLTQWMIVAPLRGKGAKFLAGKAPLFSGNLVPGPHKGEQLRSIWNTYGRKPLVLCRLDGGKWMELPTVSGRDDSALKKITHIRIYFPQSGEPLSE